MAKRKHLRKRKRILVKVAKEGTLPSTTGPFRQNSTIQTSVYFDVSYICKNISITLGTTVCPSNPALTEQNIKVIIAKIRGRLSDYITDTLADDLDFWEECLSILKIKGDSKQ